MQALTFAGLADELDSAVRTGSLLQAPVPMGFPVLDEVLGGGLRPGTLTLVSGAPAVGKTVLCVQWARHVAVSGRPAVYVSFEHDRGELFLRVASSEIGDEQELEQVRRGLLSGRAAPGGLTDLCRSQESADRLRRALGRYGERLHLMSALGRDTTVTTVERALDEHFLDDPDDPPTVFIDYLQKLAVDGQPRTEHERITMAVEAVKDFALRREVPVVCVVAADLDGLRSRRVRLHHLRGSSALAYECDAAIMMNEKSTAVSRVHLDYDAVRAASFRDWIIMSVEKNRGGPAPIHLEFRKDFRHFRFEPEGAVLTERLADDQLGHN